MKCPTCQSEMSLIPAGVSRKTGKPYTQFYSCPNRCPKTQATYVKPDPIQKAQERKNEMINGFQENKNDAMAVLNAKNAAAGWVGIMLEKGLITPNLIEAKFKEYCDFVYSYSPNLGFNPNEIF